MHISKLQKTIKSFEQRRNWDLVLTSHSFVHLIEEIGEIARHILYIEGYKNKDIDKPIDREKFGEELADALIFIVKIANQENINLEKEVEKKMKRNYSYYPPKKAKEGMKKYMEVQKERIRKMR